MRVAYVVETPPSKWIKANSEQRQAVLCPWHKEKSASCAVCVGDNSADDGYWHCFGCGGHGPAKLWNVDENGNVLEVKLEQP